MQLAEDKVSKCKIQLHDFPKENLNLGINKLVYGTAIEKYCRKGKASHNVVFYLMEGDLDVLQWLSPKKNLEDCRIPINSIVAITENTS